MNRLFRLLSGYVVALFLNGFNESFINDCYNQGINISHIKKTDSNLEFQCSVREYRDVCLTARKHGGTVKIIKKRGLVFPFAKLLNRSGIAVGILLSAAIFGILSGYVWNVDVVGNETVSTSLILDYLSQQGLHSGASWRSIDKRTVESLVMARFDEVAWVHINKFGTSARVELREADLKEKSDDASSPSNLVAKKDGFIISTNVYDGWQEKYKGDSVVKGDLLVSGVYESEHAKENMFAHADGIFMAQTENECSFNVAREQKRKVYTSSKQYKAISFFGLYIPLYIGKIPETYVDIDRSYDYININNRSVPVGIITVTAEKYKIESYNLNDEELTEMINNEANNQIDMLFGKDNVIYKDISVQLNCDGAVAYATVTAVENIAEVKKLSDDINLKPSENADND